jgi:hypothetical protein
MMKKTILLFVASASLAGCGGDPAESKGGDAAPAAAADAGKGPPADWNATDACAVVDKAAMAALIGQAVTETRLGNVNKSDGATAATSECTYALADGQTASLMLRWSPIGDNSEGSINLTRNGLEQTLKGFGGKVETIDGLGKAAFWASMTKSLNVFIGEDKFAIINVPASANAKDQAVALARKLGA